MNSTYGVTGSEDFGAVEFTDHGDSDDPVDTSTTAEFCRYQTWYLLTW